MVLGSDKDLQKVWVEPVGIVGYAGVVVLLPQLGPGNILIRNHSNMNEISTLSFLDFLDRIFCSQPFTECVAQDFRPERSAAGLGILACHTSTAAL